jgi:membrane fusion protein (multidrug efflux system)
MHGRIKPARLWGSSVSTAVLDAAWRARWPIATVLAAVMMASAATANTAADRAPLVVVSTARTDTVIKQVPLTGTVTSARIAELSAEVSGQVEAVKVEVGDRVETGAALIELDREIEQLTLEALRASSRQAGADLADA